MPVLADGTVVRVRRPARPARVVRPPTAPARAVIVRGPKGPPGQPGAGAFELQAHIDSPEPHPAYDDMLDLALLVENGLI